MRLSTQLVLLLLLLVALLFVGTFLIQLHNARAYVTAQLASHAQDAASSLGLAISSHLAEEDAALVRSMSDALFDAGDYLQVRIERMDGTPWVDLRAKRTAPAVPGWFAELVPLATPQGESTLMQGWRQIGRVLVRSHPGHAYAQLWSTARETLLWYLAAAGAVMLIGVLGLQLALRPLRALEWQAASICNREFPVVAQRPFGTEFRRVVAGMNRMSRKAGQMLQEAERLAERLREQAYQDPVTGLANRRRFMEILDHAVTHPDGLAGGLVLVQLRDFKGYNQRHGYTAGDRLLKTCGELLEAQVQTGSRATVARLAGADFAVLLEDVDPERFARQAERFAAALSGLHGQVPGANVDAGHVGAVYHGGGSASELLAGADAALRRAQRGGANESVVIRQGADASEGRPASFWRQTLSDAMAAQRFLFARQPVFDLEGRLLHEELLLRLPDPEQPERQLPARRFLPQAEATGLATALDRHVLERILDPAFDTARGPVAVNLCAGSFEDAGLLAWFEDRLGQQRTLAERLILETPEYGATAHAEALRRWIERLAPLGVTFCLDHFGRGFASFAYLRGLKAHWLKIDGSLVRELDRRPDHQFYVQAVAKIAHGLEMRVVVASVESEAVWRLLPALGLDGGQGRWLGEPT